MKGEQNKAFLDLVGSDVAADIIASIAKHYGISSAEALAEVTDEDAYGLCEYMVEPARSTTAAMMILNGFAL